MKNPNPGLVAEVLIDRPNHAATVLRHHGYVVVDQFPRRAGAMASEVKEDDVKSLLKQRPEREIGVRRQSVRMADEQAPAVRIAVPAKEDGTAIDQGHLGDGMRGGDLPFHIVTLLDRDLHQTPRRHSRYKPCDDAKNAIAKITGVSIPTLYHLIDARGLQPSPERAKSQESGWYVSYAERRRYGERVSTGFVESAIHTVAGKRFGKRQQMQGSKPGAHLMLQVRTRTLDGTLRGRFEQWYPGLKTGDSRVEVKPRTA